MLLLALLRGVVGLLLRRRRGRAGLLLLLRRRCNWLLLLLLLRGGPDGAGLLVAQSSARCRDTALRFGRRREDSPERQLTAWCRRRGSGYRVVG